MSENEQQISRTTRLSVLAATGVLVLMGVVLCVVGIIEDSKRTSAEKPGDMGLMMPSKPSSSKDDLYDDEEESEEDEYDGQYEQNAYLRAREIYSEWPRIFGVQDDALVLGRTVSDVELLLNMQKLTDRNLSGELLGCGFSSSRLSCDDFYWDQGWFLPEEANATAKYFGGDMKYDIDYDTFVENARSNIVPSSHLIEVSDPISVERGVYRNMDYYACENGKLCRKVIDQGIGGYPILSYRQNEKLTAKLGSNEYRIVYDAERFSARQVEGCPELICHNGNWLSQEGFIIRTDARNAIVGIERVVAYENEPTPEILTRGSTITFPDRQITWRNKNLREMRYEFELYYPSAEYGYETVYELECTGMNEYRTIVNFNQTTSANWGFEGLYEITLRADGYGNFINRNMKKI